MAPYTMISISSTNPDWTGLWHKDTIEQEMRDVGLDPKEISWIEFVIGKNFDDPTGVDPYYDVIVDDRIRRIEFTLPNGIYVSVIKK